jgi:hypothetical protein
MVSGLLRKRINHFETSESASSGAVSSDLNDFERVFGAANQNGVRWHLAIDD